MIQIVRTATILLGLLTVVTGVAYPIAVTAVAQIAFPKAANGSLIEKPRLKANSVSRNHSENEPTESPKWAGSELIGQPFNDPKYFWGRPSDTAPVACNGMGGSGSHQATPNPGLVDAVRDRVAKLRQEDPENHAKVPVDLVTASASGLDPHISEAAARYQVRRVARLRKIEPATVEKLVSNSLERPTIGIFGQSRVNVLKLNLELDAKIAAISKGVIPEPQ